MDCITSLNNGCSLIFSELPSGIIYLLILLIHWRQGAYPRCSGAASAVRGLSAVVLCSQAIIGCLILGFINLWHTEASCDHVLFTL